MGEAFALSSFGSLTMQSLKRSTRNRAHVEERETRLHACIQSWTMSPLYMFCGVLCVESMYHLFFVFAKYFHLARIMPPVLTDATARFRRPPDGVVYVFFYILKTVFS